MKNEKEVSIEKVLYVETQKRLDEMSKTEYEFPERIGKVDVVAMVVGFSVSMVLIILCMVGGIK